MTANVSRKLMYYLLITFNMIRDKHNSAYRSLILETVKLVLAIHWLVMLATLYTPAILTLILLN